MNEFSKFTVDEKHVFQKKIMPSDSAHNYGTRRLSQLFATPGLVAMVIEASVEMIDKRLSEGYISVGYEMGITHKNPTKVGETVTLSLTLMAIKEDEHALFLKVEAFDEIGVIAEGVHVRNIVSQEALLKKADERIKSLHI
jgi:predicted thioesterase